MNDGDSPVPIAFAQGFSTSINIETATFAVQNAVQKKLL